MPSVYPDDLDTLATNKGDETDSINGTPVGGPSGDHAGHHNDMASAILAVEAELGVQPSGTAATVVERLDAADAVGAVTALAADEVFTNHHQSHTEVERKVFTATATTADIEISVSGLVLGAMYSGAWVVATMGVANGSGGLIRDIVWRTANAPTYFTPDAGAELVATWFIGSAVGEYARLEASRRVRVEGLEVGQEYTVLILTSASSGFDTCEIPADGSTNAGGMAMMPADETGLLGDFWIIGWEDSTLRRFRVGRRPLSSYYGDQPRLLYIGGDLPISATALGGYRLAIDANGIGGTFQFFDKKLHIFDGYEEELLAESAVPSGAPFPQYIVADPANDGFWTVWDDGKVRRYGLDAVVTDEFDVDDGLGCDEALCAIHPDGDRLYIHRADLTKQDFVEIALPAGTSTVVETSVPSATAMRITPDGDYILIGDGSNGGSIERYSTADWSRLDMNREGVTEQFGGVSSLLRDICIPPDSYSYWYAGDNGLFGYGHIGTMERYDGRILGSNAENDNRGIVSTEYEGIYICAVTSAGVEKVVGYPGSLLKMHSDLNLGIDGSSVMEWAQAQITVAGGE